jgi:hypothetical protein
VTRCLISLAAALTVLVAPLAVADHMSPWGMGWASMPNDVHNTRLDPDVTDEEFRELVQQGDLADTVNRCDVDPIYYDCYIEDGVDQQ